MRLYARNVQTLRRQNTEITHVVLVMLLLSTLRRLVLLFAFLQKTTQNVSAVFILSLQTLPADHIWRNEQEVSKRLQQYPVFDSHVASAKGSYLHVRRLCVRNTATMH